MPFGDGTGPRGFGPMTGRGVGYCAGFGRPGFANPIRRGGWFGFGPGRRRAYRQPYPIGYRTAAPYPIFGYPQYFNRYIPYY